ncbi:Protein required for attachment to host cells [Cohaesibacter sp. ES.047]|uniref:host attachment family protein n=1 Tax=Cohaesibacter sp. ES.047 TaxID=1798205 RepID=UPI000BB687EC|nr:host attachment family protein [Cohaesibacter sp. ES.047]SNY90358.1 Protein required for attachment to host cells [Cohaesibacter sp. ES.047]
MMRLPKETTVVVATGESAKFFDANSKVGEVSLRFDHDLTPGDLADQGPSGKIPPDMDGKESMEATFSKILASDLFSKVHAGKIENLVLIADPETLGEMRPLLHKEVTDAIVLELDKTLTNSPVKDIEKAISAALDV